MALQPLFIRGWKQLSAYRNRKDSVLRKPIQPTQSVSIQKELSDPFQLDTGKDGVEYA